MAKVEQTFREFYLDKWAMHWTIEQIANEWARIHVEAALDEGATKAEIKYTWSNSEGEQRWIDRDSIIKAYPKDNIR